MTKDELIHKLIMAVETYSAAGDESNTLAQYRKLHDKARAIIMNDIVGALQSGEEITSNKPLHEEPQKDAAL